MVDRDSLLDTARAAFARGDWSSAATDLALAAEEAPLATPDLGLLGSSLWWVGDVARSLAIAEEVYHQYLAGEQVLLAARKAIGLGLLWFIRGDMVISSGWCNRVRRLLSGLDECPEHGYLIYLDAAIAADFTDLAPLRDAGRQVLDLGTRFQSPQLTSLGLVLKGLSDIREGETSSGFAHLDEAMLPVLAGTLEPEWAGDIYCTVIHACHQLADMPRMRAWTRATEEWCEQFRGEVIYSGICRLHRLQLQCLEGDWADAEEAIARSGTQLTGRSNWVASAAFYQLGELRRLRGDLTGARESYDRTRALGGEPQPGEALLEYAEGRPGEAWAALSSALAGRDRVAAASLMCPAVELAVALDKLDAAEHWCNQLETIADGYGTPGFRAWAAHGRGLLLVARECFDEAVVHLRTAAAEYRSLNARHDAARIHELQSRAQEGLGDHAAAAAELAQALAIYRALGAEPDARRLAVGELPGGLTEREAAVLALVATGASNRETAERLFISQKTVGRHLSNIFAKIGVSSRTAAAAWAHEQGITSATR